MKRILIIHFQPLEKYPPIQNLLNVLAGKEGLKVFVLTQTADSQDACKAPENCTIHRLKFSSNTSKFFRLLHYLYFTLTAFYKSFNWKPNSVLYYETDSALAGLTAYVARFKSKLLIHYHEYNSPQQYREGMMWIRFANFLEKNYLWKKATWISHTNEYRLKLFQKTYGLQKLNSLKVLANYPPKNWIGSCKIDTKKGKLVYVGSLGVDNFYVEELLQFLKMNQHYTLDIYGYNISEAVKELISNYSLENINIKPGVPYQSIPNILNQYKVGLILYKPFNDNFRLNETNKLFEYLSCGLEVWYPKGLEAIEMFHKNEGLNKLKRIDFSNSKCLLKDEVAEKCKAVYPAYFVAETEYEKLIAQL